MQISVFWGVPRCPGATQVHVMSNPYFCHGTQEGTQGENHLGGPRVGWLLSPDPPIWLPRVPHSGFNGRMLSSLVPSWPPSCSMASFCRGYLLGWVARFLLSPGFPHIYAVQVSDSSSGGTLTLIIMIADRAIVFSVL